MKRQIIELLKSILIVLLLCSLLLLVVASLPLETIRSTPWLSTALQPFGRILNLPQAELSYVETELPVMDAAQPLAVSVHNHAGRTSFLWDLTHWTRLLRHWAVCWPKPWIPPVSFSR